MIKFEHTEVVGWEAAMRGMYHGTGVRATKNGRYEAYMSSHGVFISCGTFDTEHEAREAVITKKIAMFKQEVLASGVNPDTVVESVIRGYFVSPSGTVHSKTGCRMRCSVDKSGYLHTLLNGKNYNIHRLIAETFIANPMCLPCVNHKDGNKLNNAVDNLEWVTHSENTLHAYKNGLQKVVTNQYGTFEVKKYGN